MNSDSDASTMGDASILVWYGSIGERERERPKKLPKLGTTLKIETDQLQRETCS